MVSSRASEQQFYGTAAMLFLASAAATITWCRSMAQMGGMPMPGGWTMSMTWMLRPGQSWAGAAGSFAAMWVVMMAAMMLPSLVPMLRRYRRAVDAAASLSLARLTAVAGLGYFAVWTAIGLALFPLGVGVAELTMQWPELARAVPFASGMVVTVAGALQFTPWKRRQLAFCRDSLGRDSRLPTHAETALRHGLRLGLHCCQACAGLTAVLLVVGVMELAVMAAVAAAITAERLAPAGMRVKYAIGVVVVAAGMLMIANAA